MTDSCFTKKELDALQDAGLDRVTPYIIREVLNGQMRIARYYGGLKFNGSEYRYLYGTDELVRVDVLHWLKAYRQAQRNARKAKAQADQTRLFQPEPSP